MPMGQWLPEPPLLISLISAGVAALALGAFLFYKQATTTDQKGKANKELLKQLLEGFGLEIPAELNEEEGNVIKTIKSP